MKKHLFLKSLLIAIGLLVTSVTTQVWATWYVKGGWNEWDTSNPFTGDGDILTCTVNIETAGYYEFKLHDGGSSWLSNTGNVHYNITDWPLSDADNCHLYAYEAGNYTFTFDNENRKLSISYPSSLKKVYYKDANSWGTVKVHRFDNPSTTKVSTTWPGIDPDGTETINGDTYYYVYVNGGYVIFNNNDGGAQTGNMDVSSADGKYVSGTGTTWAWMPATISGNWAYLSGQTISLTATPQGLTTSGFSYQWAKWNSSTSAYDNIAGATSATYTKSNCTSTDVGKYICTITKNAQATASHTDGSGYGVKVYTLNGGYPGDDWTSHEITWTSGTQGTVTVNLTEGSTYKFKVYDNVEVWFGSDVNHILGGGTKNKAMWSNNSTDVELYTGPAGDYTFVIDIANVGTGAVEVVSVTYPPVTHPAAGYVYYEKPDGWINVRLHLWKDGSSSYDTWGSGPILPETEICGTTYSYTPLVPTTYDRFLFHNSANSDTKTDDIEYSNLASYSGKYWDESETALTAFGTNTISFAGNGKTSGTMTSLTPTIGHNQTLTSNAFAKAGYTFAHWTADVDVTISSSTVSAGDAISNGATLQNICEDIELTAQWSQSITLNQNSATTEGSTSLAAMYKQTLNTAGITNPQRTGYSFAGWTNGEGGTGTVVINADKTVNTVASWTDGSGNWIHDGASTLYAKWTEVALTFSTEGNWNVAENWSPACVPTSGHDVTIGAEVTVNVNDAAAKSVAFSSGGKLTIPATGALKVEGTISNTTAANIVINSNGSNQGALIFNNSAGTTCATVTLTTQYTGSGKFQYIAIPIYYLSVSSKFAGEGVYTYVWKNSTGEWERRGYYDDLSAFEAIALSGQGSTTFSGALVSTADKEYTLTYNGSTTYGDINMFGNSWTAPIKVGSLTLDDTSDKAVHLWDGNNGRWDGGIAKDVIPAMQAFAVITKSGGGSLTINYSAVRDVTSANRTELLKAPKRYTSEDPEPIIVYVSGNDLQSRIRLFEDEQFSDELDNGWEALYMEGEGRAGDLYAIGTDKMNVLATSNLEGTVVGFVPGEATDYTISFAGDGKGYYLNDMKTGESTLIDEANTYDFTSDESTNAKRFVISKTPMMPTGVDEVADGSNARKQLIDGTLYIIRDGRIYNAEGAVVK